MDLSFGYHQNKVRKFDILKKKLLEFTKSHFEFLVMPFDLTNAPSTLMALMNEVFKPFVRKFVIVLFNYMLIYSRTKEEQVWHLSMVQDTLTKHTLFALRNKNKFVEIKYMGYIISIQGVTIGPSKIRSMYFIKRATTSIKFLRGFLSLIGY